LPRARCALREGEGPRTFGFSISQQRTYRGLHGFHGSVPRSTPPARESFRSWRAIFGGSRKAFFPFSFPNSSLGTPPFLKLRFYLLGNPSIMRYRPAGAAGPFG